MSYEYKQKNNGNYTEKAYKYIKSKILNHDYKPGESITEKKITEELDISRTPVRRAFHKLENEGLLEKDNRGFVVYSLSKADIKEIFETKKVLESYLVAEACKKRTQEDVKKMNKYLDNMEKAAKDENVDRWVENDLKYHDLVYKIAKNKRAYKIVNNLNEQWHRLKLSFIALEKRTSTSVIEHRNITEAIKEKDCEKASKNMKEHLDKVKNSLLELLDNFVIPYVGDKF
ncbi:MAG: GntR family transcriptional regulator [Bacillota bacterium]